MIENFLKANSDVRRYESGVAEKRKKSLTQALRHTTRSELSELYEITRPHEEEVYKKWRDANKRNITVDFIDQFIRMLQRICSSSIKMEYEAYENLDVYANNVLIPLSTQDANAAVVEWPVMPDDENLAPASTEFLPNMPISSKTVLVYSPWIVEDNDDVFIWFKDKVEVENVMCDRFNACDKENFYILTPFKNGQGTIEYRADVWYKHGLNRVPVAHLPANIKTEMVLEQSHLQEKAYPKFYHYRESFCFPAFENFDEALNRFSSEQVAYYKHATPKMVVTQDIECPTCHGEPISHDNKVCETCQGKGVVNGFGDFSTIKLLKDKFKQPGEGGDPNNPIYFLNPPSGLTELRDGYMHFIEEGKKSLCNDPLETTGNESGIAKEMRLEPKQDIMKAYGEQLCQMLQDMVNNRGQLRGILTEPIKITAPVYYETKSPEVMRVSVLEALQGERIIKYMDYIQAKYRKDGAMIKLYKYAVLYAPLYLYTAAEFDSAFNSGVYDERDAIRRDYALYAVGEVLNKEPNLDDLKTIREKADAFLIEQGILAEPTQIEMDIEQRAKILDTVGGADAAVSINQAVAEGKMREAAAEKLISMFFKIPIEQARELIDAPVGGVQPIEPVPGGV
jgi:hypothetical protein